MALVVVVGVMPPVGMVAPWDGAAGDPDGGRAAPGRILPLPTGPAGRHRTGSLGRVLRSVAARFGPQPTPVEQPSRFKALVFVELCVSLTWIGHYMLSVLPTIEETSDGTNCNYNGSHLTYPANVLFVYFAFFATARISLFVPCVAACVAQDQLRTHGFCRTHCVHVFLREGPLYAFLFGSMLFLFFLIESPNCRRNSPKLFRTLNKNAIYSCLVSIFCLALSHWHNMLLCEASPDVIEREDRGAAPDVLKRLRSVTLDQAKLGDDDGKLYSSECAVCLMAWEADVLIKVTPCGHAFHEECLGGWLQTARTCPVCRWDLTSASAAAPQAVGATSETAPAGTATAAGLPGAVAPPEES